MFTLIQPFRRDYEIFPNNARLNKGVKNITDLNSVKCVHCLYREQMYHALYYHKIDELLTRLFWVAFCEL